MEMVQQEKVLLSAKEVAELLGVKVSMAYTIIRRLNEELVVQKKLVVRGKINKKYLLKKLEV